MIRCECFYAGCHEEWRGVEMYNKTGDELSIVNWEKLSKACPDSALCPFVFIDKDVYFLWV